MKKRGVDGEEAVVIRRGSEDGLYREIVGESIIFSIKRFNVFKVAYPH